jgi:A/G-specific adenine glycosylase
MTRPKSLNSLAPVLLDWYDRSARALPWRVGGARRDPYRVWLSEIMLQQTTVAHAAPYFIAFTERWPTVTALADADDDAVMRAWAGLGYYARARNLLKCARVVSRQGGFPATAADLRTLPGIGPYTAGAIAALAFGARAAAVDGNAERVFSRLIAAKGPWKAEKARINTLVSALVPADRPGAFAEAVMDLGATVCTPKRPDCGACVARDFCHAQAEGTPEAYPAKPAKAAVPQRFGVVFYLVHRGHVLLVRRPETGLLGGMLALPTGDWQTGAAPPSPPPGPADWRTVGAVKHVFTHFSLHLDVQKGNLSGRKPAGLWTPEAAISGLPTVFAKAVKCAQGGD